ncbi:HAD family hydrolase [Sphingomonas sp. BN140010]|uniref:HAD family hydrolase n=1 Tax=Sphingomonas arvum TaxID=2992113 RepID=A0ABT3JE09_9SPHN|nr:HAD family hydrolase [Sphingomonas sp. BN140010]MCW3797313.1 HAD family hydrolase [Sphingomonas sp. BN140010]
MLKAILFDIDGTLVDSNDFHILAWAEAFKQAGHEFRLAEIHEQVGKGGDNLIPALLPGIGEEEAERLKKAHGELFKQHYFNRLKPFPGARDLLQRCRDAGYTVVLASSASGEELKHHLDDVLGVRDLVDEFTSADDVGCSKPCPDIFVTAAQKADVSPEEALVIGDTPYDIEAASDAGIRTIAVRSGGFRDDQLSGAIAIFDDVTELLARFDASPLSQIEEAV